jgi:hypothetical protein
MSKCNPAILKKVNAQTGDVFSALGLSEVKNRSHVTLDINIPGSPNFKMVRVEIHIPTLGHGALLPTLQYHRSREAYFLSATMENECTAMLLQYICRIRSSCKSNRFLLQLFDLFILHFVLAMHP